jgi:hypothetical protein
MWKKFSSSYTTRFDLSRPFFSRSSLETGFETDHRPVSPSTKKAAISLFPEFRSIPSKLVGPGVFPSAGQPLFAPLVSVSENFSLT